MKLWNLFSFKKPVPELVKVEPNMKSIKEIELEFFLGKPVICLSNECENLTVGIGKSIVFLTKAQQPFLVVDDIVRGQEILPMGILFAFSKQKFDALNKIDVNARIALFYNRLEDYEVDKMGGCKEELFVPEVWAEKVYAAMEAL